MALSVDLMRDQQLAGSRVLIREDLNVPVKDGVVTSDARIRAALPTIEAAVAAGAKVILMSHLGRPTEGEYDEQFSMAPVAQHLSGLLGKPVTLVQDWRLGVELNDGEVALLENVRFNPGEKADDEELARAYAGLCEIFVMDAFGTAHRAQASTHGVAKFAPVACAGPLLEGELNALEQALSAPARPMVAIVGGSKVSTKLKASSTEVHSDLLGAARAVCGDSEGIIAILGTGSNCAWYDGKSLAHRTPSLGYPLGDEGSGWRIGAAMLQGYYYGFMPEQLQNRFKIFVPDERVELLEYLRQSSTPNRYLASFATFAGQNISDDWVRDTVKTCLNEFVVKHVAPHFSDGCIHGVGGIANTFQEILRDVLQHYSLQVGRIVGDPLPDLVNYHMIHE